MYSALIVALTAINRAVLQLISLTVISKRMPIFQVDLRTSIKPTLPPTEPAGPYHYISSKNRQ